jgi:hypothetical protein
MNRKFAALGVLAGLAWGCGASTDLTTSVSGTGATGSGTTTGGTTTTSTTGGTTTTGTTGGTSTGATGTAVEQRKQQAMAALTAYFNGLAHTALDTDNQAVLAYLQADADFQNVARYQGLISMEFFDGEPFVFLNDQPYAADLGNTTTTNTTQSLQATTQKPKRGEYPTGKNFLLVNTLPADDAGASVFVANMLGNVSQFATSALQSPSISALKTTNTTYASFKANLQQQSIDVLVWGGHGGVSPNDGQYYLAAPFSPTDPDLQPQASAANASQVLVANGEVLRSVDTSFRVFGNGFFTPTLKKSFALAPLFFSNNAHFRSGSLAVFADCESSNSKGANFQAALKTAGLSFFAGWSNDTPFQDMTESIPFFFDEALGNNALWASYHSVKDPSRPWPYTVTVGDMGMINRHNPANIGLSYALNVSSANHNFLGIGAPTNTVFSVQSLDGSDVNVAGIRPSLASVAIDEGSLNLTVNGNFSTTQGASDGVSFAGQNLTVASWTPSTITCTGVPASGGGDVTVTIGGTQSNAVPITEWSVPSGILTYMATSASYNLMRQAVVNYNIRGDVHSPRDFTPQDALDTQVSLGPTVESSSAVSSTTSNGQFFNTDGSVSQVESTGNTQNSFVYLELFGSAFNAISINAVAQLPTGLYETQQPSSDGSNIGGPYYQTLALGFRPTTPTFSLDPSTFVFTETGSDTYMDQSNEPFGNYTPDTKVLSGFSTITPDSATIPTNTTAH